MIQKLNMLNLVSVRSFIRFGEAYIELDLTAHLGDEQLSDEFCCKSNVISACCLGTDRTPELDF